ncbi:unnamed protein product [Caenorhabditis brenneri]
MSNNSDIDPIPIKCDGTYNSEFETLKFLAQFVYILPGIILNLAILRTVWFKNSKVYMNNSFFVIFSVDCVAGKVKTATHWASKLLIALIQNTLILLSEGLAARFFIYVTPICPIVADFFANPLIVFKLVMILIFHSKICKSIIQALLVLNRMTCVLSPINHDSIWSKTILKIVVPLIFIIPISVDWNLAISRVFMRSTYGGLWVDYIKKVPWASQSRFQLVFILTAMTITFVCTLVTLVTLMKLPDRAKNLERAISNATIIISIGFSGTAAFQIYYGFFFVYTNGSHPIFGLNFLSWDFLTVGSPIVMLCVSSTLRKHVFERKSDSDRVDMVCDATYDVSTEIFKFVAQFLYILPGIVLNLLVLKTVWWKHSKVYMGNSFFVIFTVDCVVVSYLNVSWVSQRRFDLKGASRVSKSECSSNTLVLLTEGLMARPLLYIPPICPMIADYFDMPMLALKIIAILVLHAKICKSMIQALLVLYRMTCVLFPMRHASIWSKNTKKILVALITLLPISVDWNIAISRVYVQGAYGGLWISYIKKISWASQSRFQLGFILMSMAVTISGTLVKLPERAKNLERAISNATIILSIGFSGTAAFQVKFFF